MSFYGSVYYQLIDTFYKIIVKNSGDKNFKFNTELFNTSETPPGEIVESPAVGRKGVFSLDSGNYWINFSKVDADEADESAPYRIWHSPANPEPTKELHAGGLSVETNLYNFIYNEAGDEIAVTDKNNEQLIPGEHYIQLEESDFIRTYNAQYDEAGHIIEDKTESVLYRLPKIDTNERLDKLEDLVGEPNEILEFPRPDIPAAEIQKLVDGGKAYEGEDFIYSITDYAEKNYEDIKLLEKYVGDWSKSNDMYGAGYIPTIAQWIGDIDAVYRKGDSHFFHQNDTLVNIIGIISNVWEKYNNNAFISLSDALCMAKDQCDSIDSRLDKAIEAQQNADNSIYQIIGNFTGRPSIYSEIDRIDGKIAEVEKDYKDQDAILDAKVDKTASDIRTETSVLVAETKRDLLAADDKLAEEFRKADDDIEAAMNTLANELRTADIGLQNNITSHVNSVNETVETINQSIATTNGRINDLNTTHTNDKNALWDAIGAEENPADNTIRNKLNKHEAALTEDAKTLTNHSTRIESLETTIGSVSDEKTIVEKIDENAQSIESVNKDLTDYKAEVVATVADIDSRITAVTNLTNTNDGEITLINNSISTINGQISSLQSIDHTVYALESNLSKTEEAIADLEDIVGVEGAESLSGQNVISLLLQLSN